MPPKWWGSPSRRLNIIAGGSTLAGGQCDLHFAEHDFNRLQERPAVVGIESADVADAEAIGIRDFAGVDHEAAFVEPIVKDLKIELRVGRVAERRDDVPLL